MSLRCSSFVAVLIGIFFLTFPVVALGSDFIEQEFRGSPRLIYPGEPLVLELPDNGYESVGVRLTDIRRSTISHSRGIQIVETREWYLFLAVPNTISPGFYRLEVTINPLVGDSTTVNRVIRVYPKVFSEERIHLNRQLTEVRTANPQLRAAESDILGRVLSTVTPENWFWTKEFRFPLDSIRRTSLYGDRRIFLYDDGSISRSIHLGVDFGGPIGTRVFAPGDGRVVFAAFRQVTGWTLVLEHLPGVFTLYYHLDSLSVGLGQVVLQSQEIGKLGSTGLSTGPHLHWEARILLETVDPEFYIRRPLLDNSFRISYSRRTIE